jgi:hypothetical protein
MLALMPDVNVAPAHETPVAPLPLALDDYARSWRERAASA